MRERLDDVDFYKAVGCILVIFIHVTAVFWYEFEPSSPQHIGILILNLLSRYAVQAFVFINGYLMYLGYYNRTINLLKYGSKRFKTIVIPYLAWSAVYTLYFFMIGKKTITISSIASDLLWGRASYHLYFMVLIIQFYLLFPLLIKLYKWVNKPVVTLVAIVIIRMVINPYITILYKDRFFFTYITFYILGFVLADLKTRGFRIKTTHEIGFLILHSVITIFYLIEGVRTLLGYPRLISSSYKYISLLYIHSAIVMLKIIANKVRDLNQSKIVRECIWMMGQLSVTIYFVHRLIMSIWHELPSYPVIKRFSMSVAFGLELFITIVISIVVSYLIERISARIKHKVRSVEM